MTRRELLKTGALVGGGLLLNLPQTTEAETHSMKTTTQFGGYTVETVRFESAGVEIVGQLFLPLHRDGKRPAIPILGPFGFVKEQAPAQYASRLADAGFITLIFDPRFSGESGGTPRRHESPSAKIADARAALDFLAARPEVDADQLGALGICQGSSEMIAVATQDPRVKTLVTVSGQYLYPKNLDGFFGGGGLTRAARIERGHKAKTKFEATGTVEYTPVISLTDKNVGLPWKPIHDWYNPWITDKWGEKSRWENRYATLSDAEVWSFNVDDYAPKVSVPTLIIHGEMSDGGVEAAQHVFDRLTVKDKTLTIVPGVFHTRFYDDPLVVDPAATQAAAWFRTHLA
jgi:dienelactone hydrolase